jgi:ATP-binding cassette subfamily C protein CydC
LERNAKIVETKKSGNLLDRVLLNLEILESFFVRVFSPYLVFAITTIGICLFIGEYTSKLGWILAGGLVITGVLLPWIAYFISKKNSNNLRIQHSKLTAEFVQFLEGLEDLAAFGSDQLTQENILTIGGEISSLQNRKNILNGFAYSLALLISNLTVLGLIWFSISQIEDRSLTGIMLAVIVQIGMASFEVANSLPAAAVQLTQSITAGELLLELEDRQKKLRLSIPSEITNDRIQSLRFEEVNYKNDDGDFSLRQISFELKPGKKIALVGPSGAGKSSLIALALKQRIPDEGRIFLGGMDILELPDTFVREQFGVLGVDDYLFNTSLRENLLLAKPSALDSELLEVIDKVGLSPWFGGLPQGLNTWLGNHGTAISGGEATRLILARVILVNRGILLLDEPLTNLDVKIKDKIFGLFDETLPNASILLVTHDFYYMKDMDEILFLDKGEIVERGDHSSLMAKNGRYAKAYLLGKTIF